VAAPPLEEVLTEARGLGLLGPGPVGAHIAQAQLFAAASPAPPGHFLDLGSGAGVPGLVLLRSWPESRASLLDGSDRRAAFLRRAVIRLGLEERAEVIAARAEEAGRDADLRGAFDLVVSRGFGPPALTAECAAPFLQVGGGLLVSDPPGGADRWPAPALAALGLVPDPIAGPIRRLVQASACPDAYPRRRPARPPLF
jgi:16S rRNA (guanine527-N7)-methyltransferase